MMIVQLKPIPASAAAASAEAKKAERRPGRCALGKSLAGTRSLRESTSTLQGNDAAATAVARCTAGCRQVRLHFREGRLPLVSALPLASSRLPSAHQPEFVPSPGGRASWPAGERGETLAAALVFF